MPTVTNKTKAPQPPPQPKPSIDWKRYLPWILLILGVVLLFAMFYVGIILLFVAMVVFLIAGLMYLSRLRTEEGGTLVDVSAMITSFVMIVVALMVLMSCMVNVPAGYKCVITQAPDGPTSSAPIHVGTVINEGWSFEPYYILCQKEMIQYNNRAVEFLGYDQSDDNMGSISVISSDSLTIFVDFSLTYNIPADQVGPMRMNYSDYRHAIVEQVCRSVPRDVMSRYTTLDIIGEKRGEIETSIRTNITQQLDEKHIIVTNFALRDIRPPQSVINAIEVKKVAEQQMATASYLAQAKIISAQGNLTATLINANASAQAVIINARGIAEAQILRANSTAEAVRLVADMFKDANGDVNNTAYLQYLFIQAMNDPNCGIQFWILPSDGSLPILLNRTI